MVKRLTNPFNEMPVPLGSLITAAGQRLSARLDRSLADAGFADLRASHAAVFMSVAAEGSRVTELAERARMTKQAVGELIRYLVEHGYLATSPDPEDRRARRIQLTERGWAAIEVGQQVIADFDRWLEDMVGADSVRRLREVLTTIAETDPAAAPSPARQLSHSRSGHPSASHATDGDQGPEPSK